MGSALSYLRGCGMDVREAAGRILARSPCAAVRYCLKTLLSEEAGPALFCEFYQSKWVELLKACQHTDGGFGRFHTRDSKARQKFPTTEIAVHAMKILGLQRGNELVDKLCGYMEKLLRKEAEWPDGFEKNKWYRPAQPLFVAAKLSNFGSQSGEFREIFDRWHAVLREAFAGGGYDKERTDRAAKELLGCEIDGSYIGLNSVYLLEFFGNRQEEIDAKVQQNYLRWLHTSGVSIRYTDVVLSNGLENDFSAWFQVMLLLSKFSCFQAEFAKELADLERQRDADGFWNFGRKFACQKLSDDWRSLDRMRTDHTVLALRLYV